MTLRSAPSASLATMGRLGADEVPANYPADYARVATPRKARASSRQPSGGSSTAPAIAGFKAKYPAIKVETLDMGGELWGATTPKGRRHAHRRHHILTGTIDRWLEFVDAARSPTPTSRQSRAAIGTSPFRGSTRFRPTADPRLQQARGARQRPPGSLPTSLPSPKRTRRK
jgi:hypothetical protein